MWHLPRILPDILSGIHSDILSDISSGIPFGILSRIAFGILPVIYFDCLSNIYFDTIPDTLYESRWHLLWHFWGVLFGILSGIALLPVTPQRATSVGNDILTRKLACVCVCGFVWLWGNPKDHHLAGGEKRNEVLSKFGIRQGKRFWLVNSPSELVH